MRLINMKIKKLFLLPITAMVFSLMACQSNTGPDLSIKYEELTPIAYNDNYRTFYQIFPVSFSDSNNDGIGDLQGIIDKLDYIKSLNYTGIWLCPIHPSPSYHHYDVEDYFNVDPTLGTMQTFDNLVTACHQKGIKLIIDLVINHSSSTHQWFRSSYNNMKAGNTEANTAKLYNWVSCPGSPLDGYAKVNSGDNIAYEARFGGSMPDFNLQPILDDPENSVIATQFKKIFKTWLVDHDIDGFRLDAICHYFENNETKNLQFMTWLNNECRALKPNCYIVGEGNWGSNSVENKNYQNSGIDSVFQFAGSIKNNGYFMQAVINANAKGIYTALGKNEENANGGIETPFLGNHDVARFVGGVQGRKNASNTKFTLGLLQIMRGATFTYYGDEIGMASQSSTNDGYFRLPVRWGDSHTCKVSSIGIYNVSESAIDEDLSYPYADVATQDKDSDSVLNFARKANLIRAAFPELARGSYSLSKEFNNAQVIIKRTYNNSSINVVINADTGALKLDYSQYGNKVVAELCPKGSVQLKELESTEITIPGKSIVIIK